ncbi:MAG: polysaccharide biosynthesis tyrosine autokinase [Candidatus Limnocylindrales bacterium]
MTWRTVELSALLDFLRSYKWLIGSAIFVAAVLAALVSSTLPPTYTASARLVVGPTLGADVSDYDQVLSSQALARTYQQAATTNGMAARVIDDLGLDETPEDFLENVRAVTEEDSSVLTIEVENGDADLAAAIANAIADDLIASSASLQGRDPEVTALLQEQTATLREQIADIDARAAELSALVVPTAEQVAELAELQDRAVASRQTLSSLLQSFIATSASGVSVLDEAVAPPRPSSPQLVLNIIVAMILGLVLGLAIAAVRRTLDDSIRTEDDVRIALGVPLLGDIGDIPSSKGPKAASRLVMASGRDSASAEAIRSIRTNLEHASPDRPIGSVLVTSPGPGDGKSTIAANLAMAFAQTGRPTILVDANLRNPAVHEMFGVPNETGLATYLGSDLSWSPALLRSTDTPFLRVLPSGPVPLNPADLLGAGRAGHLLRELRRGGDIVVVDSPPLESVSDAAILGAAVETSIMVLDRGRTREEDALASQAALGRVGGKLAGVVLNRRGRGRAGKPVSRRAGGRSAPPEPALVGTSAPADPAYVITSPSPRDGSVKPGEAAEERR